MDEYDRVLTEAREIMNKLYDVTEEEIRGDSPRCTGYCDNQGGA